jgi:hypothetical protein
VWLLQDATGFEHVDTTGGNLMKRTLATSSWIVVCAFLVSAAAQTPQPPTQQPQPQAKESAEKTVTLTGCLATGEQPDTFKLTNIGVAEKPAKEPGEVVGTTGIKRGEALQLIGIDAAKVQQHVGHTVAVTGVLVPRKEGPAAPPTPATQERSDMRLNVKSFKHVDTTCPPAAK